ncbi:uncharacterized protein LOC132057432 isoform X1 [Lycium ferocissimum]|uniref:uncharacterized protein LOC132057432 isoform X1 n=1 Tax=Lycium ferocissimum TaxID=112874 RepID=UPI002814EC77|nr:uncharacterized protein LOC132057432 isoform X1 [Lycium ferocissimum]
MAQQQKHLHELLKEDQEPFQLKHYIADRRLQLKKLDNKIPSKYSLQPLKKQKPNNNNTTSLCKHACFFSFQDSPSPARKAFLPSPSPGLAAASKSPARKVFRAGPLLLEAAMRIQKNPKKTQSGFGLFGSILKKIKSSNSGKKREIIKHEVFVGRREEVCDEHLRSGSCTSCNNSRLSSAGWSESNEEEKSIDFETSSSCLSDNEEIEELVSGDFDKYLSSPLSPFRFSLQKCPSLTGCRTPDFASPVASPVHHKEDKDKNYEGLANVEQEEDEKEQCSPVSVLDPPFDDDGHEGEYEYEDEDEEDDDCGSECNYALVQRAQQQLLYKLRRFEKLAELDPIELEKLMLEEEEEEGDDDDDDSVLSYRDRDYDTFASEVTIPFDMKRLVSDLISEEKTETNSLNNREEVVYGRVCKRLESWQHVRSDTIDMMVESALKTEFDDWKKFQAQREETAMEVEVSIFRLLVEELAEEMVHFAGHPGNFNKVFA